jgi:hypothetical protein
MLRLRRLARLRCNCFSKHHVLWNVHFTTETRYERSHSDLLLLCSEDYVSEVSLIRSWRALAANNQATLSEGCSACSARFGTT